jgi:GTP pyrophosphokinase
MDERSACSPVELAGLLTALRPRATEEELEVVCRAYAVAESAHIDQRRRSGEAYITHPLAVAGILTDLNLDVGTIAAALLHDVVEDTPVTLEQIREQFGDEVAVMVDGVTKLSQREGIRPVAVGETATNGSETFEYRTEREAESLRKMMLSVVKDIRVVLIKLADRLHNMRTLSAMKPEKQRRIARETLDIYAPLANRLGIWEWKQELEDLGLRYAEPDAYEHISNLLAMGAAERDAAINRYIETVRASLHEFGIDNVEVTGRAKQIYSLWRKMQRKGATFDQIRDTQAIRVIIEDAASQVQEPEAEPGSADEASDGSAEAETIRERRLAARKRLMGDPSVQACYTALGVVHRLWPPIPGEFDDYIAVPKDNHYQSLHTAVQTKSGMLEVQIRTRSMHRSAEFGVAAHWLYKDSAHLDDNYQRQIEALRNAIKAIGTDTEDAASFVDALKTEQLIDLVFAFTPKGKVIELPVGATVLDFAYRIHSDIGDRCRGGRVNGAMQSVSYPVRNGDVVEVLTRKEPMPSRDWLHGNTYCITANAKHKIRAFFRKQDREQNIIAGRDIIDREIKRMGVSSWMKPADLFRLFKVEPGKEDDFLERIGFGNITSVSISSHIMEEERRRAQERSERITTLGGLVDLLRPRTALTHAPASGARKGQFIVAGVPGLQVQVAQCCKPVPGDPVVGYVTRGQGIRVHHRECKNIHNAEQERLIDVVYEGASQDVFTVQMLVIAAERTGLLGELATALGEQKINIVDCSIAKRDLKHGEVQVWIKAEVGHIGDISTAMSRLKSVRNVFDVQRVTNGRR